MVTDAQRRGLYEGLEETLGTDRADTLMELLPGVGWNDIARRSDIDAVNSKIDALRVEVDGKLTRLEGRVFFANAGLAIAVAGLVLGAAKLA
jgi:hypothetical protein